MNALKRSVKATKNTTVSKTPNPGVKLPKINRSKNNINESVIKEDPSEDNQDKTSIQKVSTDNQDNLAQDSLMEGYSELTNDNLQSNKRLDNKSVPKITFKDVSKSKRDNSSNISTPRNVNKSKHAASSLLSTEASRYSNMKKRAKSELRMRNLLDNLNSDDVGGLFLF